MNDPVCMVVTFIGGVLLGALPATVQWYEERRQKRANVRRVMKARRIVLRKIVDEAEEETRDAGR